VYRLKAAFQVQKDFRFKRIPHPSRLNILRSLIYSGCLLSLFADTFLGAILWKSKFISLAIASILYSRFGFRSVTTRAQEGELQVVDEVIAQDNDDVITLSMLSGSKERIDALKQSGISEQEAAAEVAKRQARIDRHAGERGASPAKRQGAGSF